MKIVWLSPYRTFSVSTRDGAILAISLLVVAMLVGFLSGVVYQQYQINQVASAVTEPISTEPTPQEKMQALTKILAELQAKVITLESLQKDVGTPTTPKLRTQGRESVLLRESFTKRPNETTEQLGQGGRFVPAPDTLGTEKKSLDELLDQSRVSLNQAVEFERQLFSLGINKQRDHARAQYYPSLVPVNRARLASPFGVRRDPINYSYAMHAGLDFAAPTGTPIYAAAAGVVETAKGGNAYGNHIVINHGGDYATLYAHCSKLLVTPGQLVQKGQLIALMGATGRVTGPHLHFEVHQNGDAINPESVLNLKAFASAIFE